MMYGAFCPAAARVLAAMGDPWMREHAVPALVEGRWTATMCMTEPQCGTDLRQLATRALPQPDGSFRLHGDKIFISGGDHDLTENIVHIVLAKIPDADGRLQPGLGSVNVFLVPARHVDPRDGRLGGRNAIEVSGLEHKMGIGGSATCALRFDGAVGWRIGSAQREGSASNMAGMFMMMNTARIGTALSGVAYAEIAHQNASAYARERLSGRAPGAPRRPELAADPIIVHPDVRRLLLDARSFVEGGRATAMRVAFLQAVATSAADTAERARAQDIVDLLTPVLKAYFTDKGFAATNDCLQVLGGHGYVRDHGMERFVRNVRIGQIYEGANGVQAMDLVNRKLALRGGRTAASFVAAVEASLQALPDTPHGQLAIRAMRAGLAHLLEAQAGLHAQSRDDPQAAGAGAYDLLTMYGILAVGWAWAELPAVPGAPASKAVLARVWFEREMPLLAALRARIEAGPAALCALADDAV
jgi:alkylation response protein AidB-like acyl-CoA dehydrogenase